METITIPNEIPVSLNNLNYYLYEKYQIKIEINEDLFKNILDDKYNYKLYKRGKNKNKVKINKKGKRDIEKINVKTENIIINKDDYTNIKNYENIIKKNKNIEFPNLNYKTDKCNKCKETILKFAVERIINIKYLSDIKKLNDKFLYEKYNYNLINNSFYILLRNHINICNLYKNIKMNLDKIYEKLYKYKEENKNVIINIIEYEILLKKILKITPTKELIDMLH